MPMTTSQICIAAVGSMTAALKAAQILKGAGVAAEVRALSPNETRKGCAYGVSYPCELSRTVRLSLQAARVSVSQYVRKDGAP